MSGSSWSLGLVEPVVAFLTGLFFGYSIWAKKSIPNPSGKSRLENDGTLNLDDDEEVTIISMLLYCYNIY